MANPSPRTAPKPPRMTAEQFLDWAPTWADGERYELIDGEVVRMAPERSRHALVKMDVAIEMMRAVAAAGLPCTVWPDGMGVRIGEDSVVEPDAVLSCTPVDLDALVVEAPVVVVEVLSPTTTSFDSTEKLLAYLRLPSIAHYLIVEPGRRQVIRHSPRPGGGIDTAVFAEGALPLDPPGIMLQVEAFFARV